MIWECIHKHPLPQYNIHPGGWGSMLHRQFGGTVLQRITNSCIHMFLFTFNGFSQPLTKKSQCLMLRLLEVELSGWWQTSLRAFDHLDVSNECCAKYKGVNYKLGPICCTNNIYVNVFNIPHISDSLMAVNSCSSIWSDHTSASLMCDITWLYVYNIINTLSL